MNGSTDLPQYSVLMSVYAGEKAEYLRKCLESMFSQTHPTDDFVLVCDGALNKSLDKVIDEYSVKYPEIFHIIRPEKKLGVGGCANAGIKACKNELIVKMDSDDIALPYRCEKQIRLMANEPSLDVCGAYIEEFDTDTGETIAVKKTPADNKHIHKYARRRNPFNNPTLVFRKSFAVKCGGYDTVKRCEDYDFVVRLLQNGARGANIPEALVRYRITRNNYQRRKNWANTKSFIAVRWRIFRSGYSNIVDFCIPCAMQLAIFIMPEKLTGLIYKKFLR